MSRRLYFLEQHCLYIQQFGFCNSQSTNQALLINITAKNQKALDNRNFACGVFLDLQKVVHTVNHEILTLKLRYYGVWGTLLDLFKNYLKNKTQITSTNNSTLETLNVKYRVSFVPYIYQWYAPSYRTCRHASFCWWHKLIMWTQICQKNQSNHKFWDFALAQDNKCFLNSSKIEIITFKSNKKKITQNLDFIFKREWTKHYYKNTF